MDKIYLMGNVEIESKQDFIYAAYCHYIKHNTVLDIKDADTGRTVFKADKMWHWLVDILKLIEPDGTVKPLAPDINAYNAIAGVIENRASRSQITKTYRPDHKHYKKRKYDAKFVNQYYGFSAQPDAIDRRMAKEKFRTRRRR